jgi:hypothetical protein
MLCDEPMGSPETTIAGTAETSVDKIKIKQYV